MDASRQVLDPGSDPRLLAYSTRSPNAFEAVLTIQRMAALVPVYAEGLTELFGRKGIGEARKAWGRVADLCAATTGLPASMETLLKLRMNRAAEVGHLLEPSKVFALEGSIAMSTLDLTPARAGDMDTILRQADLHDRFAKPLLEALRDELRAIDLEALSATEGDLDADGDPMKGTSFGDLLRYLPAAPTEFPEWDERPMFLEEQRVFLEYLGHHAAAEIVADHLVDEELGMFLLYASGHLRHDATGNRLSLEPSRVPHRLLGRPLALVCHQIGDAVLEALALRPPTIDAFERIFAAEQAVLAKFDLDIAAAFSFSRILLTESAVDRMLETVVDLRENKVLKHSDAKAYDWPELGEP